MAVFAFTPSVAANNGTPFSKVQQYTGSLGVSMSESAPGEATTELDVGIDVSAVKGFMLVSTVDCTIKTNNSTTPDNTLALVADKPYIWTTSSYDTFLFTTDITKIFVVVAGATAGTVRLEAVVDATP